MNMHIRAKRCFLFCLFLCACANPPIFGENKKPDFSTYFTKDKEIRIQTAGLKVDYFWQYLTDKNSHLLALDPKGCQLLVFDNDGRFLKRIGRPGQGPGEFNLPLAMSLDPSGRLYVEDSRMRRISVFSPEGDFLNSFVFSANHTQASSLRVDSKGNIFLAAMAKDLNGAENRANWLIKYDRQGRYGLSFYGDLSGRGWVFRMDPPFTFDIKNDIIYAMQIDRYQIDLFNSDGKPLGSLGKPPKYFVPPDKTYSMNERRYDTQKKIYDELIRLSKSWTRITRLEFIDDETILVMSAANGLVKDSQQPYLIDLWSKTGALLASGLPSEYKFLCSDGAGSAYFLIQSSDESDENSDPVYVIGKYRLNHPK